MRLLNLIASVVVKKGLGIKIKGAFKALVATASRLGMRRNL